MAYASRILERIRTTARSGKWYEAMFVQSKSQAGRLIMDWRRRLRRFVLQGSSSHFFFLS
jgi:hypothetical protein